MALLLLLVVYQSRAQICSDPANIVYGLTNAGTIHPITVSTGAVGAQMNPLSGNAPVSSNGMGYSPLNGKFYYFKRMPGSAPQEFVCFDPATNLYTMLANCPTTNYVYVGGIDRLGTGYYCWDSDAILFYYNIATNTWTTITTSLRDNFGFDVDSIVRLHGSGDLSIDGLGNMLMLPSSNTRFAVYRMNAPLPTTPVANIVVTRMMPPTVPPAKFGGIALNATGEIFLNATTPSNGLYRLNQNFTLTFLSTVGTAMGDLTSCNFPFGVLAEDIKNFQARLLSSGEVKLSWENPQQLTTNFIIEHSMDGKNWSQAGSMIMENSATSQQYIHQPMAGKNYYRIYYFTTGQSKQYSEIKNIITETFASVTFSNPVLHQLFIMNSTDDEVKQQLYITDVSGHQVLMVILKPGYNTIDVSRLTRGQYFATLQQKNGNRKTYKLIKS